MWKSLDLTVLAENRRGLSDCGMRSIALLVLLTCLGSCAVGPRIVATDSDTIYSVANVADAIVDADVVALGELHQTPGVHQTHHELIAELYERRPNMVIAMEMFERDVQNVLLQYLSGLIDEGQFRAAARPWPDYARDYRPVIEFAKRNQIIVLAANAPRPLASKAAKEGLSAVIGDANLARETTAPKDDYWDAFCEMMDGHAGMLGPGGMERYYAAQCLKDDTMAEAITDHLQKRRKLGDQPLAVLICGRMHSDHGRGTVARIKSRMPDLTVRILSAETVEDVGEGLYESPPDVADYVVVALEPARKAVALPPAAKPKQPAAAKPVSGSSSTLPTENPEGMRPALGFMPNYAGGEVEGVGVGPVREGGPAEVAGIEEGDVIVALKGIPTPDIEMYTEILDEQIIGHTITVRVHKASAAGNAEVDLQVKVGSRAGR
jgi:uncharacterized iron-regulated protein